MYDFILLIKTEKKKYTDCLRRLFYIKYQMDLIYYLVVCAVSSFPSFALYKSPMFKSNLITYVLQTPQNCQRQVSVVF